MDKDFHTGYKCVVFQKQLKWSIFPPDHLNNRGKEEMGQVFCGQRPVVPLEN